MTINEINNRITFYTGASTTQFAAADRLIAVNKALDDIHVMILQSQDGWGFDDKNYTNQPALYTDLKENQRDYSLPSLTAKVETLHVSYDGINFKRALPLDKNELSVSIYDPNIDSYFTQDAPKYDLNGSSIFLYPKPTADATAGLIVDESRFADPFTQAEVTTGTKEPGFDKQFHEMIALSASLDWAIAKGKENANNLKSQLAEYEQRIKQYYGSKSMDDGMSLGSLVVDYE